MTFILMLLAILLSPAASQNVETIESLMYADDQCSKLAYAAYHNNMPVYSQTRPQPECVKLKLPYAAYNRVSYLGDPALLNNFPTRGGTVGWAQAVWNNSDCSGTPSTVVVYYDMSLMKELSTQWSCTDSELTVTTSNSGVSSTTTMKSGCQKTVGISTQYRCGSQLGNTNNQNSVSSADRVFKLGAQLLMPLVSIWLLF